MSVRQDVPARNKRSEESWSLTQLDTPESAPDVLGFDALASTIARGLVASRPSESLTTAVYGPWGSGKTWLKYRILGALAQKPDEVTVVEFSPWQIRGVDEITLQFFAQVHRQLVIDAEKNPDSAMAIRAKMWMALARLSGAGTAALKMIGAAASVTDEGKPLGLTLTYVAGVSEQFTKLLQTTAEDIRAKQKGQNTPANADEARRMLGKLFGKPETPSLLVVMDDFDRLTSEEIQTLVRLIKANANFPGLNYLLFCDPDQLAAALDPVTSGKGTEFLEKIVQNPIHLPPPNPDSLFRQLAAGLKSIASRTNYRLDDHRDRLRAYFQNFLRLHLKNLRSVYRLLAVVDFSVAALTRDGELEVDLLDLLAVDYLRIHVPALASWIRDARPFSYFFTALRNMIHDEKKRPLAEILPPSVIECFGVQNSYAVIRTLFPEAAKEFPSEEAVYDRSLASLSKFSRHYALALSDEEHLDSYFRLQPSELKVPEAAYRKATSEGVSRSDLAEIFADWISRGWFPSAVRRLRAELKNFKPEQKTSLALAVADSSDLIRPIGDDRDVMFQQLRAAMYLMEELFEQFPQERRTVLIGELLETSSAITARSLLLERLRVRREPEAWKGHEPQAKLPILTQDKIEDFATLLAQDAKAQITQHGYFEHPYQGFRIYRWAHAVGTQRTETFLRDALLAQDEKTLLTMLRGIARSIAPKYDTTFEAAELYEDSPSKVLLAESCQFGPEPLWREIVGFLGRKFPPTDKPKNYDDCLIQHLRRALGP